MSRAFSVHLHFITSQHRCRQTFVIIFMSKFQDPVKNQNIQSSLIRLIIHVSKLQALRLIC